MNVSEQVKQLQSEDPLYAHLRRIEKQETETKTVQGQSRSGVWRAVVLGVVVAFLAYYLFQAQQKIEQLNQELEEDQSHLSTVADQLEDSGKKIGELEQGLTRSHSQLQVQGRELNQYKNLYEKVKSDQEDQNRELQAISSQKADQSQVESLKNELQGETQEIKENLQTVNSQVTQAHSAISDLREMSVRNRTDIEDTRGALQEVRQKADATAGQLSEVKHSLEREYYNFELQEKGGIMKVFNVALSLKDADVARQRYDLEVIVGTKRIRKNDQHIREPIYFYVEGVSKPYEVVVTKVDKKFVVGYLSVPKT